MKWPWNLLAFLVTVVLPFCSAAAATSQLQLPPRRTSVCFIFFETTSDFSFSEVWQRWYEDARVRFHITRRERLSYEERNGLSTKVEGELIKGHSHIFVDQGGVGDFNKFNRSTLPLWVTSNSASTTIGPAAHMSLSTVIYDGLFNAIKSSCGATATHFVLVPPFSIPLKRGEEIWADLFVDPRSRFTIVANTTIHDPWPTLNRSDAIYLVDHKTLWVDRQVYPPNNTVMQPQPSSVRRRSPAASSTPTKTSLLTTTDHHRSTTMMMATDVVNAVKVVGGHKDSVRHQEAEGEHRRGSPGAMSVPGKQLKKAPPAAGAIEGNTTNTLRRNTKPPSNAVGLNKQLKKQTLGSQRRLTASGAETARNSASLHSGVTEDLGVAPEQYWPLQVLKERHGPENSPFELNVEPLRQPGFRRRIYRPSHDDVESDQYVFERFIGSPYQAGDDKVLLHKLKYGLVRYLHEKRGVWMMTQVNPNATVEGCEMDNGDYYAEWVRIVGGDFYFAQERLPRFAERWYRRPERYWSVCEMLPSLARTLFLRAYRPSESYYDRGSRLNPQPDRYWWTYTP